MVADSSTIQANPFRVGGMVRDPQNFVGRRREIREALSRLATMQSVSIFGPRLIGKSSLLHRLVNVEKQRLGGGYEFFYLDLQPLTSPEEFYERASRTINGKADHKEDDPVAPDSGDLPDYRDLEDAIRDRRVILCLDEFEKTVEADFGPDFFDALRSLAQTGNLALVVSTKRPLNEIYRQASDLTSSFSNIFTPLPLGPLTEAEAEEFLQTEHSGFTFTPDERDRILRIAGTHPYWLNAACAKVFEARQQGQVNFAEIERQVNAERAAAEAPAPSAPESAPESPPPTSAPLPASEPARTFKLATPDPNSVYLRALVLLIIGLLIAKVSGDSVGVVIAAIFFVGSLVLALNHEFQAHKEP